jgi:outer membrane assembly lipoprotein YfiO
MRFTARSLFALLVLASLWGCGPKGAKLQKSVVPPDRTLFETGSEYLRKSQYIKARLAFQTLINTYPDSELSAESYLSIGDSFYDEGGTENLLQAEDQYKNFIIFFPTHPKAPDAQMKVIAANMKLMRAPDRDPQYSYKAEGAIRKMLETFPDSDYAPIARQYLKEVQETLAQGDYGVGKFYAERGNQAGARSRFKEIVDKYPDYSAMDEVYFQLADSLLKANNPDEAAIYLGRIASGFPFSRHFDEAKSKLGELNKPVPQVDTQLAAANQAKVKQPEGFSPLKPFVSFVEALGFKGPEDRYELARRTVEEQKAATATAQAEAAAAEGGKAGDNILIETTLRKDASGQTQTTTVLGPNQASADPKADPKKRPSTKNNDKKKNPQKPSGQ